MRVVLFKVNHLGDNVVFLPVVQTLQRLRPDWRLTVITAAPEAPLYRGGLPPAHVWTPPSRQAFHRCWRRPWVMLRWWWRLRQERPDACLLSYDQGNVAHLLARWSGAAVRIGTRQRFLRVPGSLTHAVPRTASRRIVDWNWAMGRTLIEATGGHDWPEAPPPPALAHLTPPDLRREQLVVIHAGARNQMRRWGAERMAEVGRRLARDGRRVVWIERPDTHLAALPAELSLARCDRLEDLVGWLARASLLLCNHSGPLQLADALGTPSVVISGPTGPGWDPCWYPARARILRMPGLACIGCEDREASLEVCTNPVATLICLHHWTIAAVAQACEESLGAPATT